MHHWGFLFWQGGLMICSWWIGLVNDVICLLALSLWQYFELACQVTNDHHKLNRALFPLITYVLIVSNGILLLLEVFKHIQTNQLMISEAEIIILIIAGGLAYGINRWFPYYNQRLFWIMLLLLFFFQIGLSNIPVLLDIVLGALLVIYLLYRCHSWVVTDRPKIVK